MKPELIRVLLVPGVACFGPIVTDGIGEGALLLALGWVKKRYHFDLPAAVCCRQGVPDDRILFG